MVKLSMDKTPESYKELNKMRLQQFQGPILDIPDMFGYFLGRLKKIRDTQKKSLAKSSVQEFIKIL